MAKKFYELKERHVSENNDVDFTCLIYSRVEFLVGVYLKSTQ